jgi:hypothetical protein
MVAQAEQDLEVARREAEVAGEAAKVETVRLSQ